MPTYPAEGAARHVDAIRSLCYSLSVHAFFEEVRKERKVTSLGLDQFLPVVKNSRTRLEKILSEIDEEGYRQRLGGFWEKANKVTLELESVLEDFKPWSDDIGSLLEFSDVRLKI